MLAEFISGVCPFRSEAAFKYGQSKGKKEKEKVGKKGKVTKEQVFKHRRPIRKHFNPIH